MLGQNKPGREIFKFDLENELKDPKKRAEIQEKSEKRIQELKTLIHNGTNPAEFEDVGHLLHGYLSLEKILKHSTRWS
jgi:hypothetical protein